MLYPNHTDATPDIQQMLSTNQTAPARKWVKRLLLAIVVLVVIFAGSPRLGTGKAPPIQCKTADVRQGDLTVTVTATGNLVPTNLVDVGTRGLRNDRYC